jgi:hypothetical protein
MTSSPPCFAAFIDQVRARPPKPSLPVTQSPLPAFRKRKPP